MAQSTTHLPSNDTNGINTQSALLEVPTETAIQEAALPDDTSDGDGDGDGGERPVREKLKKTSIAGLAQQGQARGKAMTKDDETQDFGVRISETSAPQSGPAKKRSFDDLQEEDILEHSDDAQVVSQPQANGHHKKIRSRDIYTSEDSATNGQTDEEHANPIHGESNDTGIQVDTPEPEILTDEPSVIRPINATPPPPSSIQQATGQNVLSPRKKRSRDQFDKDEDPTAVESEDSNESGISGSEAADIDEPLAQTSSRLATGEPEKKRHRDASEERKRAADIGASSAKVGPTSGFANSSTASPFGALAPSKSPPPTVEAASADIQRTSTSAFASSGLSSFANAEKSPFGALASSSSSASGFGSLNATAASGGFGSSGGFGGASAFATKATSGFGGLGSSGFGSTLGGGFGGARPLGGLSSFAAPSQSGSLGGFGSKSSARAFGAPPEETENDEGEAESEGDDEETADEKPKERRFHEQEHETGEEEEETIFSCRAKLFHFEDKEWKERGVGTFKINIKVDFAGDNEASRKARLIMRTDGVHRVVLNTPVFKGMKVGNNGEEPNGKTLSFGGMENGKPALFALKMGKEDVVRDLYHKLINLQEEA